MTLQSTKPDSKGKEAALKRAALLTEFRWTPLLDVPTYTKEAGITVLPAGVEVKGMPYSSAEPNDKFITENVSFETLLSAIANPDSVLYHKTLNGRNHAQTYYGMVCNTLVRYSLGIKERYNTRHWADIPGMYLVKERQAFQAEDIELCDILHVYGNERNHVALITDLLRDENGIIVQIEVSEAVRPVCKRERYDVDVFMEKYHLFALWRYALIDEVPEYDPSAELLLYGNAPLQNSDISVDHGNKSNYMFGEETVISVFRNGENRVEICCDGTITEQLTIQGSGQIKRTFERGYYRVTLKETQHSAEFCVNSPKITPTLENEYLHLSVDPQDPESEILHMDFRAKGEEVASLVKIERLSQQEQKTGIITRKIPEDAENFKVYFQNRYGIWTHPILPIGEKKLHSTLPDSQGKAAALKRAAQLTEFRWTPVRDIPTFTKATGKTVLSAGKEVKGMIYSSPEPVDKFITENVSFETFLSAVANPDSVLYTKDLGGRNNSWAYYGIVCNGLARYALDIKGRYSTKRWPTLEGMRMIKPCGEFTADEIRLCDILYAHCSERSHVAFITDLLRDDSGRVVRVEVSEAVRPSCIRKSYDLDTFYSKFAVFGLWRYDHVDQVPECNPREDALLAAGAALQKKNIALNYGNKSNYLEGEETVISIFCEGENSVEVYCDGILTECIKIKGPGQIHRCFSKGYYTAVLKNTTETVEFCVNHPQIAHTVQEGSITVTVDSGDPQSEIYYMDFREMGNGGPAASLAKLEKLNRDEIRTGVITRQIPEEGVHFKVYFRNRYGVWTHRMIPIYCR